MNRFKYNLRLNRLRARLLIYKIPNSIQLFLYLTISHFYLAITLYFFLRLIMPHGWVFGALYRMPCYHWEFPAPYIALVVLIHSSIITILFATKQHRNPNILSTLVIMILTIFIASPLGGLLWVYHDMELGYYPTGDLLTRNIFSAVRDGICTGWFIILLSFPYNLIGIYIGSKTIKYALRTFSRHPKYYLVYLKKKKTKPSLSLSSLNKKLSLKSHIHKIDR